MPAALNRSLAHGDPAVEQQATDLLDDTRALPDLLPASHSMQNFEINLPGQLQRYQIHF
jgi:hypothetical protein